MDNQKPISMFTLCDEDGNKYEINEFKSYVTTSSPTIDPKIIERPLYKTLDGQEVIPTDNGFELLNPPNNIKLFECE